MLRLLSEAESVSAIEKIWVLGEAHLGLITRNGIRMGTVVVYSSNNEILNLFKTIRISSLNIFKLEKSSAVFSDG